MKKIWIVNEECHGDVSYWSTKRKAYKEVRDIIMTDPYYLYDGQKITKEEIEDGSFGVCVRSELFNKSWR
jgi:hypothetical protein